MSRRRIRKSSERRRTQALIRRPKRPAPTTLLKRWFQFLLTAGSCAFSGNQLGAAPATNYTVTTYRSEQGLPSSVVLSVTQTRDGYLWLGTLNGLVRFDGLGRRTSGATGVQFPVFDEGNTPGLRSSVIVKLFEDSQGNLWIGTETGGIVVIKEGKIVKSFLGAVGREGRLKSICEDSKGTVWLYTADGQLFKSESAKAELVRVPTGVEERSISRCVIVDNSGRLWLGSEGVLECLLDNRRDDWAFRVPIPNFNYLIPRKSGGYWLFASGRIWSGQERRFFLFAEYPWNATNTPVNAVWEDQRGNLIVGTGGQGVYLFDTRGRYTLLSKAQGTSLRNSRTDGIL